LEEQLAEANKRLVQCEATKQQCTDKLHEAQRLLSYCNARDAGALKPPPQGDPNIFQSFHTTLDGKQQVDEVSSRNAPDEEMTQAENDIELAHYLQSMSNDDERMLQHKFDLLQAELKFRTRKGVASATSSSADMTDEKAVAKIGSNPASQKAAIQCLS
jgi:hypothetical protein